MHRRSALLSFFLGTTIALLLLTLISPTFQADDDNTVEDDRSADDKAADNKTEAEEIKKDDAREILIFDDGDPFYVYSIDNATGCLNLAIEDIPPMLQGTQSFKEPCDPTATISSDPSTKCKAYITAAVDRHSSKTCLKPTHLICDPSTNQCGCGNEGVVMPEIRFQFGTFDGKNHPDGRCFIRPTFDFVPGIECSPGTKRQEIAVQEGADATSICACENDLDFDKFSSVDPDWWSCGRASPFPLYSKWLLLLAAVAHGIVFLTVH